MFCVARRFVRRLHEIFERIAYAGLQPGAKPQRKRMRRLGPLSGPINRFLSGGAAPSDPLYLTNRTLGQKIRPGLLIGVPCLVAAFLVYGMLSGMFNFSAPPAHEAAPREAVAKMLPRMDPNMRVETAKDIEVMEVRVEHGPPTSLVGSMKNRTDHEIHIAEAVFDLTDAGGSGLGGVSARIENFKAGATANFKVPIQQDAAAFALVREIHTQ